MAGSQWHQPERVGWIKPMSCRIRAGPEVLKLSPSPPLSPTPRTTESASEWEGGSSSSLFLCNTLGEYNVKLEFKTTALGTSLLVQGTGICLPVQRTQVRSLVQEDFMFCGAIKAPAPQPLGPCAGTRGCVQLRPASTRDGTTGAHAPRACVPPALEPRGPMHLGPASHQRWDHGGPCT